MVGAITGARFGSVWSNKLHSRSFHSDTILVNKACQFANHAPRAFMRRILVDDHPLRAISHLELLHELPAREPRHELVLAAGEDEDMFA